MKKNKKGSQALCLLLSLCMTCGTATTAFAAPAVEQNEAIVLSAEDSAPEEFSVSLPSKLPVYVNKDHKVYVANAAALKNVGQSDLQVASLNVKAAKDWDLAGFNEKLTPGSKLYGWRIQNANVREDGTVSVSGISPILEGKNVPISYDVNVAQQESSVLTYANTVFCVTGYDARENGQNSDGDKDPADIGENGAPTTPDIGEKNPDENSEITPDPKPTPTPKPSPDPKPDTKPAQTTVKVAGVKLNKDKLSFVSKGASEALTATVAPSNATNKGVTWSSSNTAVAAVDANGKVTAAGNGKATITVKTKDGGYTASCEVTVKLPVAVTGVSLDAKEITLTKKGETRTLIATVSPKDATDKTLTWVSSNPAVATVDANGKVTAVSDGITTITVKTKDGGFTAGCKVTVKTSVDVTGVVLNNHTLKMTEAGETSTLKATVSPSNATDKSVTWSSSNSSVASVDKNGKVTAKRNGTATITVKTNDGGFTDTCTVTVKIQTPVISYVSVSGVRLNRSTLSFTRAGEYETLTATVYPSNASNKAVTWSTSNRAVATVSSSGKVTAVANGTTVITVKTNDGGYTATCTVTVNIPAASVAVTGVSLNKDSLSFTSAGANETLVATVAPANATNKSLTWNSSNPAVATVNANGKVTAVSNGTTVITVKTSDGGFTATCMVLVNIPVPVTGVTIDNGDVTLTEEGQIKQLTATVQPENAGNKELIWTSSNPDVATVDKTGKVTAVSNGTTTITVKTQDGGFTDSITVTVNIQTAVVEVTGITLNKSEISMDNIGDTEQLIATVTPANATNKTVTWTSDNASIASVDQNGLVTMLQEGAAVIKAETANGFYATCTVSCGYTPFTVTSENRNMVGYDAGTTSTLTIPGTFTAAGTRYRVVAIGNEAFKDCDDLQSVQIPNTVMSIGHEAFRKCDALSGVSIPNSVATLGNWVFADCPALVSITIPGSIAEIPGMAFQNDTALNNVTLNEGLTKIDVQAFYNCTALQHLSLPESITTFGNMAFYNAGLTEMTFPENVETLGSFLFSDCKDLTTVTFDGNKVTTLPERVFQDCESLTDFIIPSSVTTIGARAFYGCQSLTSIIIPDTVTRFEVTNGEGGQFLNCQNLESITFSRNMTEIPNCCFGWSAESLAGHKDAKLETVVIPEGIERIGDQAFYSCKGLKNISLPSSVREIGNSAFYGSGLEGITIPEGVETIGEKAFTNTALVTAHIPSTVTSIGENAFQTKTVSDAEHGQVDTITDIYIDQYEDGGLTGAPWGADEYTTIHWLTSTVSVTSISISPSSVALTEAGASQQLTVTFNPSNATNQTVTWSSSDDSIATVGNTGLVTAVANGTATITAIAQDGNKTASCEVEVVTYELFTVTADNRTAIGYDGTENEVLVIPSSFIGNGENGTENGVHYKVVAIGENAFSNCTNLMQVTLSDEIRSIGESAFSYCSGLTEVIVPDSVTQIGNFAFRNCTNLGNLVFSEGVTSIGAWAFFKCSNLSSVNIPESVTSIGTAAFDGCSELDSVILPEGISVIEPQVFRACSSLTTVSIPVSVSSIQTRAFDSSGLTDIYYSGTKEQWNLIEKAGSYWHYNTPGYTIHCSDGDLMKS